MTCVAGGSTPPGRCQPKTTAPKEFGGFPYKWWGTYPQSHPYFNKVFHYESSTYKRYPLVFGNIHLLQCQPWKGISCGTTSSNPKNRRIFFLGWGVFCPILVRKIQWIVGPRKTLLCLQSLILNNQYGTKTPSQMKLTATIFYGRFRRSVSCFLAHRCPQGLCVG